MTHPFDPYHQWLGIRDPQRPPNLYRLLGVELFEADADVIETAADRQMAHLRTYQHGPHAAQSQQLLNEVSAAKVCLLDAAKKAHYDEQLRLEQRLSGPSLLADGLPYEDLAADIRPSHVALRPPGRGPRAERPWYVSMMVLLPVLGIVLCLVAYRVYRDFIRSSASPADVAVVENATVVPPPATRDHAIAPTGDATTEPTGPPADQAPPSEIAPDSSSGSPSTPPGATENSVPAPDSSPDSTAERPGDVSPSSNSTGTDPVREDKPSRRTAWDPAAVAISGEPARFTTTQPMGPFLMGLGQRDLAAADSALQALRAHRALGIPEDQFRQAELVREIVGQFWAAVDLSLESLAEGDNVPLGEGEVVVAKRNGGTITLKAVSGEQQVFELQRSKLHRDLAIGLVRREYRSSPPVAWRLIAVFLAIDQQGDVKVAEHLAQQADLQGVATTFLTRIVRSLSGNDDPAMTESPMDSVPSPLTEPAANSAPGPVGDNQSKALPDAGQQQKARREVLAPILNELRQHDVPADQWARQLLERAESDELDAAGRYVVLDSALKRARARRDIDTALAVIDVLARDFERSRTDLRYELLQTLTRRLKGEDRRRYAELAQEMARTAVAANEYDEAIRFASLAQSIGRSVPDRFFRRYLLDFRLEIDAIRQAFEALQSSNAEEGDRGQADPVAQARFRVLSRGDFDTDMSDLKATDDAALRAVVEQELSHPTTADHKLVLARAWRQLSEQFSSIEQINALRRAQYWYSVCLPDLSRVQRGQVQPDLDAIARVLGHKSDRFDLTTFPPVSANVGFGTFGVNENIDVSTHRNIQPLPQLDGNRVTRFFWACAPSRLEYFVPEGARRFRAVGIVNAATQDGVRFVVKADNEVLFVSPLMKAMGDQLPIEVDLPDQAETLELIVQPQKTNAFDHTYWVNPELIFSART